jgi:putative intracellular protease/amidase
MTSAKMKKTCLIFLFDGYSDWEVSYASVGIQKSVGFTVKTIAATMAPMKSMGGFTVLPDVDFLAEADLADIDRSNTAMLILPGGAAWEQRSNQVVAPLVVHCLLHGIPVAAICGATVFLADAGVLNRTAHTSNHVLYLEAVCPAYKGRLFYQHEPAVSTGLLITASGAAPVDFAREIFSKLDILKEDAVSGWFSYIDNQAVIA